LRRKRLSGDSAEKRKDADKDSDPPISLPLEDIFDASSHFNHPDRPDTSCLSPKTQ